MALETSPISRLKKLLEEELEARIAMLVAYPCGDHASYLEKFHYIKGIRYALDRCEEAERITEPPKSDATDIPQRTRYED